MGDASTALPHALSGPGEVVFVNVTKEEFVSSSGLEEVRSHHLRKASNET